MGWGKSGRRSVGWIAVGVAWACIPLATSGQDVATAQRWLDHLAAVLAEDADSTDVDALLSMYHPYAAYEHPAVGARIEGIAALRAGRMSYLGQTRRPRLDDVEILTGPGVVALSYRLTMEARSGDDWTPVERSTLVVLEFDGDRIVRVIDH